jgi:hypothetical protein
VIVDSALYRKGNRVEGDGDVPALRARPDPAGV